MLETLLKLPIAGFEEMPTKRRGLTLRFYKDFHLPPSRESALLQFTELKNVYTFAQ